MARRGKKYLEARTKIDSNKRYAFDEAISLALGSSYAEFDESVDVAVRLAVDPRHAEQMVRGAIVLPHGTGRSVKILVFAKGEKEKEATDAGADYVGGEDLAEKIKAGWQDFDKVIATPDMMSMVGKLGRILGPRGMMPNPKLGTVTFDIAKAVKEMKEGRVEFRVDKTGIIHCSVGRISFGKDKLLDNVKALLDIIIRLRPASSKGMYLKGLALSSTLGPSIKVDPFEAVSLLR